MDMWICTFVTVMVLSYSSHGTNGHAMDFNKAAFTSAIDTDSNDEFTVAEVEYFFPGEVVTRCAFEAKMIPAFSGDTRLISVLYDSLHTDSDISTLRRDEFRQKFLGQSGSVTREEFEANMNLVLKEVHDMELRPYQFTEGAGRLPPDSYKAQDWADDMDTNDDGDLSHDEISLWMNTTLDDDGDFLMERCEFVEAMRRYSQHPSTSANMYNVLFHSRDLHWADVDSIFLATLISKMDKTSITTEEFTQFFTEQNKSASGEDDPRSPSASGNSGNAGKSVYTSGNSGLWLLVRILPALLYSLRVVRSR